MTKSLEQQVAEILSRSAGHGAWEEWLPEAREIIELVKNNEPGVPSSE